KLCLEYEVMKRKKLVKKELIVDLKGELYFVKFIINPEEDDFVPGVILGKSFLRIANGIVDFGNGVITIYLEPDPFEDDFEKTRKSLDDWDQLLNFDFDDVPKFREELPSFVCKKGKSSHNKKRAMENLNLFYLDVGPSLGAGVHLTQEEKDKVELDGKTMKEDEEAVRRIKGKALKEKDDPSAFIFPIRLEEAMGKLSNVLCQVRVTTIIAKFLILDIPIDHDALIVVGRGFLHTMDSILNTSERIFSTFDGICHQTFRAARFDVLRTVESDSDDEEELQDHTTEKPDCTDLNAKVNTKKWKRCCFHKFLTSSCYGKDVTKILSLGETGLST
nr:hypothetical protein [Tanacetum cinerariifolium]